MKSQNESLNSHLDFWSCKMKVWNPNATLKEDE